MSFFAELKRRNVFRVAAAYIIVGWLLLQISDTLVPALYLPGWLHSGVAFVLIIGGNLRMICFNSPVPDAWQPLPETCEGIEATL